MHILSFMKTDKNFLGLLIKNFSLKEISSFKMGGKAKYYFIPDHLKSLVKFLHFAKINKKKFYIIGNASNILFNDRFYNGYIINLRGFTNYIIFEKGRVICGVSLFLQTLIDFCISHSLKGLEKLSGIPGTIGGALIMNAGAFGTEIGDYVEYVKVLTISGSVKIIKRKDIKFSYRHSYPLEKYIILEAGLRLKRGIQKELLKVKKATLKQREEKQPWNFPSCGSIFKRPKDNFAGTLIERAGLKGVKIGGAQVSKKHANFIINTGKAEASDVMKLICLIRKKVWDKFMVKLEPEIKFFNFLPQHHKEFHKKQIANFK